MPMLAKRGAPARLVTRPDRTRPWGVTQALATTGSDPTGGITNSSADPRLGWSSHHSGRYSSGTNRILIAECTLGSQQVYQRPPASTLPPSMSAPSGS